ncbi:hypothetical protein [Aureimonas sp. N4]|uniref:hypothetical protein n=1 Tax=Aureimonas sp. N4 TaxID=1638165 RepID=UPI0007841859|nr:hypothetical protein [Aureimonas sp. N4]
MSTNTLNNLTAYLDFMTVICALVTAIGGPKELFKGLNAYEIKQNTHRRQWNQIFNFAFKGTFICAALSYFFKAVYPAFGS